MYKVKAYFIKIMSKTPCFCLKFIIHDLLNRQPADLNRHSHLITDSKQPITVGLDYLM